MKNCCIAIAIGQKLASCRIGLDTMMQSSMIVRTERDCVLHGIIATQRQLQAMMHFQIGRAIRKSHERGIAQPQYMLAASSLLTVAGKLLISVHSLLASASTAHDASGKV